VPLSQSLSLLIASRLRRRASSKDLHPGHEPRHVAGGLDATSHQSLSGQAPMKFLLSKPLLTGAWLLFVTRSDSLTPTLHFPLTVIESVSSVGFLPPGVEGLSS
jgi:hypothetical protein